MLLPLGTAWVSYGSEHPGSPTISILHSFAGTGADGAFPDGPLVIGANGVLYGATFYGGTGISCGSTGCGTIYSLTPPSSSGGAWTAALVHDFAAGGTVDGNFPIGGLTIGTGGVLYGVTYAGGTMSAGSIFSLTAPAMSGQAWTETILYNFILGSKSAQFPASGLAIDKKTGTLYGTTYFGGSAGAGTVYSLAPPSSPGGPWLPSLIYSFPGGSQGANPVGGLALYNNVLYGTTSGGGSSDLGIVYSLTPMSGGIWTPAVLHSFGGPPADGAVPLCTLTVGGGGKLYGTTAGGGASSRGTVFQLTPPAAPNGPWTEAVLYNFTGGSDGGQPRGGVVWANSLLLGTALFGGAAGYGAVFSLTPPAPPATSWTQNVSFSFPGGAQGANPQAGVVLGSSGLIYGVTYAGGTSNFGTVFSLQQ